VTRAAMSRASGSATSPKPAFSPPRSTHGIDGAAIPPAGVPEFRSSRDPRKLPKQAVTETETAIFGNGCRKRRIRTAEKSGSKRIRYGA